MCPTTCRRRRRPLQGVGRRSQNSMTGAALGPAQRSDGWSLADGGDASLHRFWHRTPHTPALVWRQRFAGGDKRHHRAAARRGVESSASLDAEPGATAAAMAPATCGAHRKDAPRGQRTSSATAAAGPIPLGSRHGKRLTRSAAAALSGSQPGARGRQSTPPSSGRPAGTGGSSARGPSGSAGVAPPPSRHTTHMASPLRCAAWARVARACFGEVCWGAPASGLNSGPSGGSCLQPECGG